MSQLLVREALCINPDSSFRADLLIEEGQIVRIGRELRSSADHVIDATGKVVLPGGIDSHVHLPWPSGDITSSDDFQSGTKAAAFGGVTTVIDFVIPDLGESLEQALENKLTSSKGKAWVDYGLHLNIRGEIESKLREIPELVARGYPSYKIYMAYEGFRLPDDDLLLTMQAVASAGGVLLAHAEDGLLADHLTQELANRGKLGLSNYPMARPMQVEIEAIKRILSYVRTLGGRLHIVHVSTARGAALIGKARREGLQISGETCPHYLLLDESGYMGDPSEAAFMICAPSIKSREDQSALWRALANNSLNVLATDHCPYTREQKEAHLDDFTKVPGGMGGVETRLPLIYTEGVLKGRLTPNRFVSIWATEPAKTFGLFPRKGIIAVGSDADLVILDPTKDQELRAENLHMRTDCLPFEGRKIFGLPLITILRGEIVVEEGKLSTSEAVGTLIERHFEYAL